jgi:hypothetical protein
LAALRIQIGCIDPVRLANYWCNEGTIGFLQATLDVLKAFK